MPAGPEPRHTTGALRAVRTPLPQMGLGSPTEDDPQHLQRLEVVGHLAGGIAHDFNNTLTIILSYGELIKTRLGPQHPLTELAEHVVQAAEQGAALTKQLLTFTRRHGDKTRVVDVRELLDTTQRALSRVIPRSIQIVRGGETRDPPLVEVNALQLQQAILNLVLNARDAMPRGGDLHLNHEVVELPGGDDTLGDATMEQAMPGSYVVVRVRDSGSGISADVLPHIFEPFFTTKEPGRGTGLGLSNVQEIAEAAGGFATVRSEPGCGAEFALYLPRVDGRSSGMLARPSGVLSRTGARILVVDDEPQICEVMRAMLIDGEYTVTTAENAEQALSILAAESVDLVCTDLLMPEMGGGGLIDEVKRRFPGLPVIVCSAYGNDIDVSHRLARGDARFLAKPFTQSELLKAVESALDASTREVRREGPRSSM